MKGFLVTAFLAPAAYGAEHFIAAGAAPGCQADGAGSTHVYYSAAQHVFFKTLAMLGLGGLLPLVLSRLPPQPPRWSWDTVPVFMCAPTAPPPPPPPPAP